MPYAADKARYGKMNYRRCGKSGLLLPEISLGLWQNFGGTANFAYIKKMIFKAFDFGITHFDLANNYGPPPGAAEENFGNILKSGLNQYRDEIIISSKAGYYMWPGPYGEWGSRKYLISSINQSLKRLQVDYVDIFYSHRFDPETPLEETAASLDSIVRAGKALYAGISNYSALETRKMIKIFQGLGTPFLIHQPRYSMFDRGIEDGLIKVLEKFKKGCIVFSPLAQGVLSDKYLNGIPKDSRAAREVFLQKKYMTPEKLDKIVKLKKIAETRDQTISQMAIAWILRFKSITSVLIGASRIEQILENIKSLENTKFTKEELSKIDNILKNK